MRSLFTVLVLVCAVTSGALAGDRSLGDWVWNVDDPEMLYAATENSAGQTLVQLCDATEGSCFYAVGFDTSCDEGDSYPALVNTDDGAYNIEFLCGGKLDAGGNLMLVKNFDQIDGMIRKARRIGFALPMQGDEFKAVRFSLKGAVPALDAMRKFAAKGGSKTPDVRNAKDSEVF